MEDDEYATSKMGGIKLEDGAVNGGHSEHGSFTVATKSEPLDHDTHSPALSQDGLKSRSDSVSTPTSQKPKLSRKSSQQPQRQPFVYGDLPDMTEESCSAFQVIPDCLYGSKHLGATDNDSLDCDCNQEWQNGENVACGEDSDCINRATKMECSSTGNCGGGCQNQRFRRREYARVSVIKTEKKGYGLRADVDLHANDFIFEYIGEVINEPTFRRRMIQYDDQGIKHFYFMSLSKSEFVDATKKGNLGRFCNHSCNPNCYVDKWVVGDKLRMGIFALRRIRPGEELVFNYNVDRYGAKPQPCYCGEHNCIGFIGGKTQTERATKLPAATVEALGIDGGDGWDTSVAKKPRKKRADEDDEEYVSSIQPRSLDEDDARKVMATLMQCKEKWIAVKLLERIQRCDEERVIHVVMRMHAYQILKTVLNSFYEDYNVVLQVLLILDQFPRLTRNKIADSKIEASIEPLTNSEHEEVASTSQKLLKDWSKLEFGYRIRRRQGDASTPTVNAFDDRRGAAAREGEIQAKVASPQPIDAPKGPRSNQPQRGHPGLGFFNARPPPRPRQFQGNSLPAGWFEAQDDASRTYFYDNHGTTTWIRPSKPAVEPAVNKAAQEQLAIQNIIKQVTKDGSTPKPAAARTPQFGEPSSTPSKEDKWRSLPVEKQMKIYENTIFPPVKHMLDKFKNKLPKDELKRLAKDISKKLVASDYKNKRVTDPSAPLGDRQTKKITNYVKEFLDKAVLKYNALHGSKGHDGKPTPQDGSDKTDDPSTTPVVSPPPMGEDSGVMMSDGQTPSDGDRKRKREDNDVDSADATPSAIPDSKRLREEQPNGQPEPPPPPPPPAVTAASTTTNPDPISAEQQAALRAQEEALIRENEEAERLEEQAHMTEHLEQKADEMQRDIDTAKHQNKANQEVMGH